MAHRNAARRVLFVNHVAEGNVGGAETVLRNIVRHLDRSRFHPLLLMPPPESSDGNVGRAWDLGTGIEHFHFGTAARRSRFVLVPLTLIRMIWATIRVGSIILRRDIDIVCANTLVAGLYVALPTFLTRRRFIYYEHNLAWQRRGHLLAAALGPVSKLAHTIICISSSVGDSLIAEGVPAGKLRVVRNGYDFSELEREEPGTATALPNKGRNEIVIGMIANFIPWKRHEVFIDLVDRVARRLQELDVTGVMLGGKLPGNEDYYETIQSTVHGYRGPAALELIGFQKDIVPWLKSFDLLVNTSDEEPFGLTFLEGMFVGCVVAGSVRGAAPEIISDQETGFLLNFNDLDSEAARLADAIRDRGKLAAIKRAARDLALRAFSIERQIRDFERVLMEAKE